MFSTRLGTISNRSRYSRDSNERMMKVRRKYNSNSSNSGTTIKNVKCMFYVLFLFRWYVDYSYSVMLCVATATATAVTASTEYTKNHCFGCVVWPMPIYPYNTFLLLQLQLPLIYCSPDALCALINIKTCTYISK